MVRRLFAGTQDGAHGHAQVGPFPRGGGGGPGAQGQLIAGLVREPSRIARVVAPFAVGRMLRVSRHAVRRLVAQRLLCRSLAKEHSSASLVHARCLGTRPLGLEREERQALSTSPACQSRPERGGGQARFQGHQPAPRTEGLESMGGFSKGPFYEPSELGRAGSRRNNHSAQGEGEGREGAGKMCPSRATAKRMEPLPTPLASPGPQLRMAQQVTSPSLPFRQSWKKAHFFVQLLVGIGP